MSGPIKYIAGVLCISWVYTWFIFSAPERLNFFPWIMLLPGTLALVIRISSRQKLKELFAPLRVSSIFPPLSANCRETHW